MRRSSRRLLQKSLAKKLCHCIKKVRKSKGLQNKERSAIGICVKSVLHSRGKTLKKFTCKPPNIITQKLKN